MLHELKCLFPSIVVGPNAVGMLVGRQNPGMAGCKAWLYTAIVGMLLGGADTWH